VSKSARRFAVAMVIAFTIVGCSDIDESAPVAIETSSTPPPPPPPPPTSVLSGREGIDGPLLVVKIDDTAAAHPQIGMHEAEVVYVEQVEAGLTRLAVVYSSQLPAKIGPVRSARISDLELLAQYGKVAFAYSGAQGKLLPVIARANLIDLGAQREPPSVYTRDSTRRSPVNMVLLPQALLDRAASRGKFPDIAKSVGWNFGDLPEGGERVTDVEVRWPGTRYAVSWNASSANWSLRQDGRAEVGSDGRPFAPSTIVIQLVNVFPSAYGDRYGGVTPMSETVGEGRALVLRDGRLFRVRWNRPSAASPTSWRIAATGEEMLFAPGQVWVLLADRKREPVITPLMTPSPTPTPSSSR
jgi:hypothetical protein